MNGKGKLFLLLTMWYCKESGMLVRKTFWETISYDLDFRVYYKEAILRQMLRQILNVVLEEN